jgi:putative photosynthetic complex assembly protein
VHTIDRTFPRIALISAGALIGLTLVAVLTVRLGGGATSQIPASTPIERLELRFEDRPDGAIAIHELPRGNPSAERLLHVLDPGTNGFIRGVMRGFARERRSRSVGTEPPFELIRWADGRLSLNDPSTGRHVDLGAFGPTNVAAFAEILLARRDARLSGLHQTTPGVAQ